MPPRPSESDPTNADPLPAPHSASKELPESRLSVATVGWALLPVLLPGLGAPMAFGIGAARRPSPGTVIPLIAYTAAVFGFCAPAGVYGSDMPLWLDVFSLLSLLSATFGASGHLFAIRRKVWSATPTPVLIPVQHPLPPAPSARRGIPALDQARHLRGLARQVAEDDPLLAKRMRIGRPDLPRSNDDGGLIDINHAPAEVLRELPGFTEAMAEQLRDRVERVGPYQDLNEVIMEIGVPSSFERHLREYVVLIP